MCFLGWVYLCQRGSRSSLVRGPWTPWSGYVTNWLPLAKPQTRFDHLYLIYNGILNAQSKLYLRPFSDGISHTQSRLEHRPIVATLRLQWVEALDLKEYLRNPLPPTNCFHFFFFLLQPSTSPSSLALWHKSRALCSPPISPLECLQTVRPRASSSRGFLPASSTQHQFPSRAQHATF